MLPLIGFAPIFGDNSPEYSTMILVFEVTSFLGDNSRACSAIIIVVEETSKSVSGKATVARIVSFLGDISAVISFQICRHDSYMSAVE